MIKLSIEVTGDLFGARDLPAAKRAFAAAAMQGADFVKGVWIGLAGEMGVRNSGRYIAGIQASEARLNHVRDTGDLLELEIDVVNTAPHAMHVEHGHGGYHLPSRINWADTSGRIKHTSTGKPYITVPFRHRAFAEPEDVAAKGLTAATQRAMMPQNVDKAARGLKASRGLNQGPFRTSGGRFVAQDRYNWGDRLERHGPNATGGPVTRGEIQPHWSASKYQGMVRFEQKAAGNRTQPSYVTFRRLTPHSRGWFIPPLPGKHIMRRVAQAVTSGPGGARLREQMQAAILRTLGL